MAGENIHVLSSSSSSSHRLPTVSASQALQTLHTQGSRAVSTGLPQLDKALSPLGLPGRSASGGYIRGKVTEIFGPPGAGKTAFGIQAAANALRDGHRTIWVDAACAPLVPQRVNQVLLALDDAQSQASSLDEWRSHFHHFTAPTLAHLLALFMHLPSGFPLPNTSLIVIDSLSTLFDNAYPRHADDRAAKNKGDQARWAAGRKFAVMNELISTLTRVAALHDIALLVTCQTITRIRAASKALLVPAISGSEWDNGISTRLVLFRDWAAGQGNSTTSDPSRLQKARFAGILKANGATLADEGGVGEVVPFVVDSTGLYDMNIATIDIAAPTISSEARPLKRRFAEMDDDNGEPDEGVHGPNSDELYGWVEDDEVAAEGLLFEDASPASERNDSADTPRDLQRKVTRPATF
ncbi:P-loop containing nucleoside triphosphate hydrolase protein [Byssothecium circinans]|uniref:P-loop containing nucleoside triphosphate hydrolase protein n=1 Tax=Byssothecium circinans TaxID=147558 RepID=A0A6A5UD34_9PLEO|nr:P-loop containing nucleoside triphosphate hydrolase protein [Byssothecium circinans]